MNNNIGTIQNYSWNDNNKVKKVKINSGIQNYSWNGGSTDKNTQTLPIQPKQKTIAGKVLSTIGNFTQSVASDITNTLVVTPGARATEAITRTLFPNSLATKGFESMADQNQAQSFNVPILNKLAGNIKVNQQRAFGQGGGKQVVGQALHSAGYLAPFAKLPPIIGNSLINKLTPIAVRNTKYISKAIEGAIAFGTFGAGTSLEENKSTKDIIKTTLTDAALGAILGVSIPLLKSAFKKGDTKLIQEMADRIKANEKVRLGRQLQVIGKKSKIINKNINLSNNKTLLQEPGILEAQRNNRNFFKNNNISSIKKELSIDQKVAKEFHSKSDYINFIVNTRENLVKLIKNKSITDINGKKIRIPTKKTEKQLGKIWDIAHEIKNEKTLIKQKIETPVIKETPISKTEVKVPKIKTPNAPIKIPKDTKNINDSTAILEASTVRSNLGKVDSINLKEEGRKAQNWIETVSPDKAFRVAMKEENAPPWVRATAVHSKLFNYYNSIRRNDKVIELLNSDLFKTSAQDLNLAKLKNPDNASLAIKEINDSLKSRGNIFDKMKEKTIKQKLFKQYKGVIEKTKLTVNEVSLLAKSLICK